MADDDAGQQLPDSTDPFVLLGVARDADERTLRAAYAALTRRYRPEQAPEQFARIHDAFARAREMQQFARAADEHRARAADSGIDAAAETQTVPTADAATGDARGIADAPAPASTLDDDRADELLARAAAAAEPSARDALITELLAANAFAPAVRRAPHLRDAVLGSAAIAWNTLADVRDRFAAIALWRGAWDRAYLAGELDRAQAMLEDVRLAIDATEDLDLARAALDRVIALAWKRAVSDELVDSLRAAAEAHYESVQYLPRFDRELALATKVAARPLPPELSVLPAFLVAGRLRDFTHRKRFALDMHARLGADPAAAVVAIGAYRKLEPHVTRSMVEVVGQYLPEMRTRLDHLPRARFEALTRGLVAAGATPRRWLPLAITTAAVIAAAFVAGVPGIAIAGTAAIVSALLDERRRYQHHIRPPLARLIHAVPVRVDVIAQWIRANPRLSGRLGWYDITIENDPDLDLFSLLAAASAEEANVIEREVYET